MTPTISLRSFLYIRIDLRALFFQVECTDPEVLGTLYVVRDGQAEPEEWTLLDRPILKFGFCKE